MNRSNRLTHWTAIVWSSIVTTLTLGMGAPCATAHDLWIEPSTFHPAVDELVWIGLRIGHPHTGAEPVRRNSRHFERFALRGPEGETPIPGLDGREPAGWIRPPAPGRYSIVLRSQDAVSVLPGPAFESYLQEEGLESVSAERARRGETDAPGSERYSRALKALLTVGGPRDLNGKGDGGELAADRPLGLRLELVARADPWTLEAGDSLPVELRFEDRPLAGALIEATPLGAELAAPLTARTDAEGRVAFTLPETASATGAWLLSAVHMVPAPATEEEDWESVWTALTFSLGPD